jgi:hypothetical protein
MTEPIALPLNARGKRPQFFEDPALDLMMSVVLELTQELSVLYDRVDALQRLMDARGVLPGTELENWKPDAAAEAQRAQRRAAYLERVFRVLRREAGVVTTADAERHTAEVEASLAGATSAL